MSLQVGISSVSYHPHHIKDGGRSGDAVNFDSKNTFEIFFGDSVCYFLTRVKLKEGYKYERKIGSTQHFVQLIIPFFIFTTKVCTQPHEITPLLGLYLWEL